MSNIDIPKNTWVKVLNGEYKGSVGMVYGQGSTAVGIKRDTNSTSNIVLSKKDVKIIKINRLFPPKFVIRGPQ